MRVANVLRALQVVFLVFGVLGLLAASVQTMLLAGVGTVVAGWAMPSAENAERWQLLARSLHGRACLTPPVPGLTVRQTELQLAKHARLVRCTDCQVWKYRHQLDHGTCPHHWSPLT